MSLLELLEHVELITYLVSFEFYTPHLGVLKGAAAFLLTLFSISLTHCCTKSLPKNCKSTDEDQWYAIGTVHKRYNVYKPIRRYEQHLSSYDSSSP